MREKAEILFRYGGVSDAEAWVECVVGLTHEPSFRESDLIRRLNVSSKESGNKYSK